MTDAARYISRRLLKQPLLLHVRGFYSAPILLRDTCSKAALILRPKTSYVSNFRKRYVQASCSLGRNPVAHAVPIMAVYVNSLGIDIGKSKVKYIFLAGLLPLRACGKACMSNGLLPHFLQFLLQVRSRCVSCSNVG